MTRMWYTQPQPGWMMVREGESFQNQPSQPATPISFGSRHSSFSEVKLSDEFSVAPRLTKVAEEKNKKKSIHFV